MTARVAGEDKGFSGVDVLGADFGVLHGIEGKIFYNLGRAELVFTDRLLQVQQGVFYRPNGISAAEYDV